MGEAILNFFLNLLVELIWNKLFNFIGGAIRWLFVSLFRIITGKPKIGMLQYIKEPTNQQSIFAKSHQTINSVIGLIAIVALFFIIP